MKNPWQIINLLKLIQSSFTIEPDGASSKQAAGLFRRCVYLYLPCGHTLSLLINTRIITVAGMLSRQSRKRGANSAYQNYFIIVDNWSTIRKGGCWLGCDMGWCKEAPHTFLMGPPSDAMICGWITRHLQSLHREFTLAAAVSPRVRRSLMLTWNG